MAYWRRELAREGMLKSLEVRQQVGVDMSSPLCIYAICEALKVSVRFVPINMEGTYVRAERSSILLSALRPQPRRVFTCGHELGHHIFGHGSTIDELMDEVSEGTASNPNEFLVNAFAGFLLMPTLGVRRAFTRRGWNPETATPLQIYTIACSFGVGYETLVSHLCYGLQTLPRSRAQTLLKSSPKSIRATILSRQAHDALIIADIHWGMPTLDAEIGNFLLLPHGACAESDALMLQGDVSGGRLFKVVRSGITRVTALDSDWAVFVRSSRYQYVGLSQYRHLEDEGDE